MRYFSILGTVAAMLALILDSRTAIQGAADALQLCIKTAIPSLFPFFVLSGLLVPYASKLRIRWLGQLLGVPDGWESVFILGSVSGYPVGAQCVAQGYRSGKLSENHAKRMLGFCTNCGPSFIFGIAGNVFPDLWTPFSIMVIGLLSAVIVGAFWPGSTDQTISTPITAKISMPQAVQQAIRSMASVCAWVILSKVILAFLGKWILWRLPVEGAILANGVLELTNGCLALSGCQSEVIRFVIANGIISFGGFCVAMQAASVCGSVGLDSRNYLPQKTVQGATAATLAAGFLYLPGHPILRLSILTGMIALFFIFAMEIQRKVVYNSPSKGGI